MEVSAQELERLLARFGHTEFRHGQERIIRAILDGRDALAVLPTGSGKSLVYQLASQILPGLTIVVSPLIALMKDQVESLRKLGVAASLINSALTAGEQAEERGRIERGEAKLLYLTPERFENDEFVDWIGASDVSLMVVDEAHCITEWGHDFRPAYLGLAHAAEAMESPSILALTATASPWVRQEILERLGLEEPLVVVSGIDRPNLFFEVLRVEEEGEDHEQLRRLFSGDVSAYPESTGQRLASTMQGSGIIYTRTTKAAEETVEWLREWGIPSDFYHGQRESHERDRVQHAFMYGELRVICATNAFGLGVDKPDVRFVIHRDIPASVEEYFQEAGRAGRDGDLSRCVLLYRPGDLGQAAFLAASSRVTPERIELIRSALADHPSSTIDDLVEQVDLGRNSISQLLAILKREGLVDLRQERFSLGASHFDVDAVSTAAEDRRKAYERSRLEMMRAYAESDSCRRRFILNYFGEEYEPDKCDMCDNDLVARNNGWVPVEEPIDEITVGFKVGDQVSHPEWGSGAIHGVEEDVVTVLFQQVGYKRLDNALVVKRGLLKPEPLG